MAEPGFKDICKVVYICPATIPHPSGLWASELSPVKASFSLRFSWLWPSAIKDLFSVFNPSFSAHSFFSSKKHSQNPCSLKKKTLPYYQVALQLSVNLSPLFTQYASWKRAPNHCPHCLSSHPLLSEGSLAPGPLPTEAALAVVAMAIHLQVVRFNWMYLTQWSNPFPWHSSFLCFLLYHLFLALPASLAVVPYLSPMGSSFPFSVSKMLAFPTALCQATSFTATASKRMYCWQAYISGVASVLSPRSRLPTTY